MQECSRICCQNAVKNALHIKKENPDCQVFILYRDIRTYGLLEDFYKEARDLGVIFMRFDAENPPDVRASDDGIVITTTDHVLQRKIEIQADLLTLSAGMRPNDTKELSGIMKLNANLEGYFMEAHVKLRPVDMPGEGIFLCGTAHGPKLISEAISQAQAAASRAVTFLARPEIKLSAITAKVDTEHCVKCLTCLRTCPYDVPSFNMEKKVIEIDEAMCHGCGACAGACPRQTIQLGFYGDDQIICKIDALLAGGM
jgi:heterodisulfide reductase subunit A-like polyferredoxin